MGNRSGKVTSKDFNLKDWQVTDNQETVLGQRQIGFYV